MTTRMNRARQIVGEAASVASLATNVAITRRYPVSVVHFVTRRCNARCSFCFIDFDNPQPKSSELSLAEIEQLTRTMGRDLTNVNLTGGEPFLRADLDDIARAYYRNAGVRSVYITSNGAFPDRVDRLGRTVMDEFPDRQLFLSFSIDGLRDDHDRIRKVTGLFDKTMASYSLARDLGSNVVPNIAITVSDENADAIPELYSELIERHAVRAITAIAVRDEGVYSVPDTARERVGDAYRWLTRRIVADQHAGRLDGYDPATVQGRLMNRKNEMLYEVLDDIYDNPRYISPCHAGALFGVIDIDGTVHPCEVLDRPIGSLRDNDMNFMRLWRSHAAKETTSWIRDTNCHCTYECAWGFNIMGNLRYQPRLAAAIIRR